MVDCFIYYESNFWAFILVHYLSGNFLKFILASDSYLNSLKILPANTAWSLHTGVRSQGSHQVHLQRRPRYGEKYIRAISSTCVPWGNSGYWNVGWRFEVWNLFFVKKALLFKGVRVLILAAAMCRVIYQTRVKERNRIVLSGSVELHRWTSSL